MKPIKYELISCEIGTKKLFFNGIKIDTKQEVKRVTHSGSYDAMGYVTGDKTVDFSLTDPKDAQMTTMLYNAWTELHIPFTMMMYGKNTVTNGWDPVAMLGGCVLNKVDHNLKAKEEWKPSVSGMALEYKRLNYQFDPRTGLLSAVGDAFSAIDSQITKGKNLIGTAETVISTARGITGV